MPTLLSLFLFEFELNYTLNVFGGDDPSNEGSTSNKGGESSGGSKGPKTPSDPNHALHSDNDNNEENIFDRISRLLDRSNAQLEDHKEFLSEKVNPDKLLAEHKAFEKIILDRKVTLISLVRMKQVHIEEVEEYNNFIMKNNYTLTNKQLLVKDKLEVFENEDELNKVEIQRLFNIHNKCALDRLEKVEAYIDAQLTKEKYNLSKNVKDLRDKYLNDKSSFLLKESAYHLKCKELGQESVKNFLKK